MPRLEKWGYGGEYISAGARTAAQCKARDIGEYLEPMARGLLRKGRGTPYYPAVKRGEVVTMRRRSTDHGLGCGTAVFKTLARNEPPYIFYPQTCVKWNPAEWSVTGGKGEAFGKVLTPVERNVAR